MLELACDHCGKSVRRYRSEVEYRRRHGYKGTYCSQRCSALKMAADNRARKEAERRARIDARAAIYTFPEAAMAELGERQRHVIESRRDGLTYEAIGRRWGVTRARIIQIEAQALEKLHGVASSVV